MSDIGVMADNIWPCKPNKNWPWREACHLFTDGDIDGLHRFAQSIGLRRRWFQNRRNFPHYDLTVGMRKKAIKAGAADVTIKETARVLRRNRVRNLEADKP